MPSRCIRLAACAPLLATLLSPASGRANTPQDLFGVGARNKSMGGAGTAAAQDHTATYYNPANLAYCRANAAGVEVSHVSHGLDVDVSRDDMSSEELNDRTAVDIGVCLFLPFNLSLGVLLEAGMQRPQSLYHTSVDARPRFATYGQPLEQITFMGGLSYRLSDKVAIGAGGAVLVSSALDLTNNVPVITEGQELMSEFSWNLEPVAAGYLGVAVNPTPALRLGASYRSALYHKLDATAYTSVELAGVLLNVDLLLEAVTWYSPQQAALGASYSVGDRATIAADITWYDWSSSPGPFLRASPLDPDDSIAGQLEYPPVEEPGFSDIFVPRVGGELYVRPNLALRTGVSFRPSAAPLPAADQRSNLLDGSVTTLSLGGGYSWGGYPVGGAGSSDSSDPLAKFSSGNAPRANGGVIDFHARLHVMGDRDVSKVGEDGIAYDLTFGGWVVDAGMSITLGWF